MIEQMDKNQESRLCRMLRATVVGISEQLVPFKESLHITVSATFVADNQLHNQITFQEKLSAELNKVLHVDGLRESKGEEKNVQSRHSCRVSTGSNSENIDESTADGKPGTIPEEKIVSNLVKQAVKLWYDQGKPREESSNINEHTTNIVAADIGLDFVKQWDWPPGSPENRQEKTELRNEKKLNDTNSKYRCDECGKGFAFATNLTRHYKNIHGISKRKSQALVRAKYNDEEEEGQEKKAEANTNKSPYKCTLCGKECPLYQNLGLHLLKAHGVRVVDLEMGMKSGEVPNRGKGKYKCLLCGHRFTFQSNLSRHYSKMHKGKKKQKMKQISSMDKMKKKNTRSASPENSIKKDVPIKENDVIPEFTKKVKISKSRTSERARHKCEFCGCRFTFRSNLNRHINKVHRNRSPLPQHLTDTSTVQPASAPVEPKVSPIPILPRPMPISWKVSTPLTCPPSITPFQTSPIVNSESLVVAEHPNYCTPVLPTLSSPSSQTTPSPLGSPHISVIPSPSMSDTSPLSIANPAQLPNDTSPVLQSQLIKSSPPEISLKQPTPVLHSSPLCSPQSPPLPGYVHSLPNHLKMCHTQLQRPVPANASLTPNIFLPPPVPKMSPRRLSPPKKIRDIDLNARTCKKYSCLVCNAMFSFEANVKRHFINQHGVDKDVSKMDSSEMYKETIVENKKASTSSSSSVMPITAYPHGLDSLGNPVPISITPNRSLSNGPANASVKIVQVPGEPTLAYSTTGINIQPTDTSKFPLGPPSKSRKRDSKIKSSNEPDQTVSEPKKGGWKTDKPHRFSCKLCDAHYTFRTNLTRHVRQKHGKNIYEVENMDKSD